MEFGVLSEIEQVEFSDYQTCKGSANRAEFENIINILIDPNSTEDEFDDAVNDGLWDLFSNQYTLYSSTPLALYLILTRTSPIQRMNCPELIRFIELCASRGNDGVLLNEQELIKNQMGVLPIFSIPEIICKYA
ncbi:hypothetical protein AN944_04218 [Shewanella sp. P1-14-1]|nr:hypothetical protein AN944_04218 [Shewanella sp. P1-14-1]